MPTGSPITVARAKPLNTRATAAVCFSGGAAAIAICEATAMKSACASAEPIRPAIRTAYEPASAETLAAPTATAIVAISSGRRGTRRVSTAAAGPPTVTTPM